MAKTGLSEIFEGLFLREDGLMTEVRRTPPARLLRETRKELLEHVKAVGRSGDLNAILAIERSFLQNDLDRHANSTAMTNSLKAALAELDAAEALHRKVQDPAAYKATDEDHSLPRNRVGGLPRDQARQFFASHAARLLNQDKSRLDPEEKRLVEARKNNMRVGEKVYAALQRKALGVEAMPARGHDRGMEM